MPKLQVILPEYVINIKSDFIFLFAQNTINTWDIKQLTIITQANKHALNCENARDKINLRLTMAYQVLWNSTREKSRDLYDIRNLNTKERRLDTWK